MLTDKFGGPHRLLRADAVHRAADLADRPLATEYRQFLVAGLFVGFAGGSFGRHRHCARWFGTPEPGLRDGGCSVPATGRRGHQFVAPTLVVMFGWQMVPQVCVVAMLITAVAFWFFTYDDPSTGCTPR